MNCNYAQDFIYKGVAVLDTDGNKCRLRNAKDVARVILAKASGWDSRYTEVMNELENKGFDPPFDKLKLEGHLLMDEFVESSVVVREHSLHAHLCAIVSPYSSMAKFGFSSQLHTVNGIMCTKRICSRVSIQPCDRCSIKTLTNISINTQSTLRQQSMQSGVD